jgi:PleD family two-component response regulator
MGTGDVCAPLTVGVAVVGQGSASPEALLPDADRALYAVKAAGRNAVKLWSGEPLRQAMEAERKRSD